MRRVAAMCAVLGVVALLVGLMGCGGMNEAAGTSVGTAAKPPPPPPPTPTPSRIAFQRWMTRGSQKSTYQIFSVYTNGTGVTQLTTGSGQNTNCYPSWAPDGRLCFDSARVSPRRIYIMNANGTGQTAVTAPPSDRGDALPDWCPNPSVNKIAFYRYRPGTSVQGDIWTVTLGNTTATQLTTSPYLDEWPSWSPNGDFIVFRRRQTTSGPFSLCVVPAAGGAAVPLEWPGESITGAYPDWSKDGASIVYYSGGLKRIPVDPATGAATGPPVSITTTTMYHPTWSPLDEFLTAEAAGQVVKVSPSTGVVLQTLAAGKFPDWSPAVF